MIKTSPGQVTAGMTAIAAASAKAVAPTRTAAERS